LLPEETAASSTAHADGERKPDAANPRHHTQSRSERHPRNKYDKHPIPERDEAALRSDHSRRSTFDSMFEFVRTASKACHQSRFYDASDEMCRELTILSACARLCEIAQSPSHVLP